MAAGSGEAVVMEGAALIVRENKVLLVALAESVTLTVKLDVPAVVGVPLRTPVELLSVSPVGSVPERIVQV